MGKRKLEEVISSRSDKIEGSENDIKTRAFIYLRALFYAAALQEPKTLPIS